MAFAQLTFRESLRDIEACLRSQAGKLYHMGIRSPVLRSTLADANESRDWRIYADFAQRYAADAVHSRLGRPVRRSESRGSCSRLGSPPTRPGALGPLSCKRNELISEAHSLFRRGYPARRKNEAGDTVELRRVDYAVDPSFRDVRNDGVKREHGKARGEHFPQLALRQWARDIRR